jgi:hypothetical protein
MNKKYFRVFDANLNRAREGLRVVEDTLRFVLDDKKGCSAVRKIRHRVDSITREIYPRLIDHRDSESDHGRRNKETQHRNVASILAANFRRAEESLRVLEEYSRLADLGTGPSITPELKESRFELYILEKKIVAKNKTL